MREELAEINPKALFADGLDEALIGYTIGPCGNSVAVYDAEKCIDVIAGDRQIDRDVAEEYLEHNTFCAYVGPNGPIYVRLTAHGTHGTMTAPPVAPLPRSPSGRGGGPLKKTPGRRR